MNLPTKAVCYHLLSIGAGAWGAIIFAQSGEVDLYAIFAQAKRTWGELVILSGMLAPIVAAGFAAYRTFGSKQVPAGALTIDVGSKSKTDTDAVHSPGQMAAVTTVAGTATGRVV